MIEKESIQVVWLKKDLRLHDHAAFHYACQQSLKTLIIYLFEPNIINNPDYDQRHYQFIVESIHDMNSQLEKHQHQVNVLNFDALDAFKMIQEKFQIKLLISHVETGNFVSFKRDLLIKDWCAQQQVPWIELKQHPVFRVLKERSNYNFRKNQFYGESQKEADFSLLKTVNLGSENQFVSKSGNQHQRQKGGETEGLKILETFIETRHKGYIKQISKPSESSIHCSRLSPYLTFGCLSEKYVMNRCEQILNTGMVNKRDFEGFLTRLKWRSHFVQKLESAFIYEFQNINPAFDKLDRKENKEWLERWQSGNTGYPLVDACMRSLNQTGWINFRMRAMLVSLLCHTLWQPWQKGAHHLARMFLDYEPGIHYPQIQMQASTTGVHTLRIYNPVKQSYDQDPDSEFISQWIPELEGIPKKLKHEPWKLNPLEISLYQLSNHKYPQPMVDFEKQARHAKQKISEILKSEDCQLHAKEILVKLSNPKMEENE
ncbi:MAG: FAD-binding domain-containing protein [Cytophagales bacterium]